MGEKIRELRKKAKLSQDELAEMSGVSRVTINNIETGRIGAVMTTTLQAIAEALGVPVGIFFE